MIFRKLEWYKPQHMRPMKILWSLDILQIGQWKNQVRNQYVECILYNLFKFFYTVAKKVYKIKDWQRVQIDGTFKSGTEHCQKCTSDLINGAFFYIVSSITATVRGLISPMPPPLPSQRQNVLYRIWPERTWFVLTWTSSTSLDLIWSLSNSLAPSDLIWPLLTPVDLV